MDSTIVLATLLVEETLIICLSRISWSRSILSNKLCILILKSLDYNLLFSHLFLEWLHTAMTSKVRLFSWHLTISTWNLNFWALLIEVMQPRTSFKCGNAIHRTCNFHISAFLCQMLEKLLICHVCRFHRTAFTWTSTDKRLIQDISQNTIEGEEVINILAEWALILSFLNPFLNAIFAKQLIAIAALLGLTY